MAVINPATTETLCTVPSATTEDVDRALEAAVEGFRTWSQTDAWTRCEVLRDTSRLLASRSEDVAATLTAEQGKPLAEARGEVAAAVAFFDWCADEARRLYGRIIPGNATDTRMFVIKQPIGVVAAFTPFNFPAYLPARKIGAALAAGCSVVLKPAEETPLTSMYLAQAFHDAGLPPGVLNILVGDPQLIGTRLVTADVVRKVSLTGSVPVGRELARLAADGLKEVSLELGGHSAVIVCEDADVEKAAATSVEAKFRNAGQVCISPSRWFVHTSIADEFTERFVAATKRLRIGDGRSPDTDVGPLTNQRRVDAIQDLVDDSVSYGATVCTGGHRVEGMASDLFYAPTVLSEVSDEMRVMTDEPFGPVAPIATFSTLDEAIERANATDYGLAGYVFTDRTATAFRAAEGLEVGMVGVNNLVIARPEAPFGGVKHSGYGREGGAEGIEAYAVTKYVNIRI
jgi:succinate-semialdehyde dehydrogenase/glutarate-semialdehyde dehydrogenase